MSLGGDDDQLKLVKESVVTYLAIRVVVADKKGIVRRIERTDDYNLQLKKSYCNFKPLSPKNKSSF